MYYYKKGKGKNNVILISFFKNLFLSFFCIFLSVFYHFLISYRNVRDVTWNDTSFNFVGGNYG